MAKFALSVLVTPKLKLENHCTPAAQSSHVCFNRGVHRVVYLAVEKDKI